MRKEGRIQSRAAAFLPVLGIILLMGVLFGCSLTPSGNLAFFVELTGYTSGPGTEVETRIHNPASVKTLKRSLGLENTDSGAVVFPGIEEGTWDVSISIHDGDEFLGETQFSVRARGGETVASTISAVYTDGALRFSVTSGSTQVESSLEISEFDTLITAGRRIGMTDVDVGTRSIALGSFSTAAWLELTYPDSLEVTAGSRASFEGVYFNVYDSSIDFYRPEFHDTGGHSLIIEDEYGSSITENDSIGLPPDSTFFPEIINPAADGDLLGDGGPVDWINGNSPEVTTVGIILYEETTPDVLVHTEVSLNPQGTSQFTIPFGTIDPVEFYRVIIFTTDVAISESEIAEFATYKAIQLPYQAVRVVEENISGFAYYERRVDGN